MPVSCRHTVEIHLKFVLVQVGKGLHIGCMDQHVPQGGVLAYRVGFYYFPAVIRFVFPYIKNPGLEQVGEVF
ncbi:hypothetical protein D3Z53_04085 [Lachnospiraceae bacterium]|nr:hypothetical protein [Lachnospiraceae bacterium]